MKKESNSPLISILMLSYNHARYIEQAINSILSQDCKYPFELVICDDASVDGTDKIIEKYAAKHSNIHYIPQPVNGRAANNFIDGISYIRTKYIAFCEGDDYWQCNKKLEKQIDFLEANPDFSVTCHKVEMFFENKKLTEKKQYVYKDTNSEDNRIKDGIFYADEAIANYFFQTSSFVFRWRFSNGLPDWFRKWMMYDHAMLMLHAVEGKIKYFDEAMSVWRRNETGYSWLQTIDRGIFFQKEGISWIEFYKEMDSFFGGRFHLQIRERILLALRNMVSNHLENGNLNAAKSLIEQNKDWILKLSKDNFHLFETVEKCFPEERFRTPPWKKSNKKNNTKSIGGLKQLDLELIPIAADNIFDSWTKGHEHCSFSNKFTGLINWIYLKRIRTIWLPTLTSEILINELKRLWLPFSFYSVGSNFSPNLDFIEHTQSGDAILTVAWNGKPPSIEFRNALKSKKDTFWIEDRSQSLKTDTPYEANLIIFSPSEVLGVPDGCVLIGDGVSLLTPEISDENTDAYIKQRINLIINNLETNSDASSLLIESQVLQNKHPLPAGKMSDFTMNMLKRIPIQPLVDRSQRNWKKLAKYLSDYALNPKEVDVDFAPYSYPILVPSSIPIAFFVTALTRKGIIAKTASNTLNCSTCLGSELAILNRILFLPCDHRYSDQEMEKIISEVLSIARGESDLGITGERFIPA